ncbi:hypothetical protein B0H14DRAFT_2596792 [Mycena olivaceomarginata]|nr:hypothetical protein B0H14DRAFT_2596792 [Mycena olivaceomarginata]
MNSTTATTAPTLQSTPPLPTPSTSANTLDLNAPAVAVPEDLTAQSQEPNLDSDNESDAYRKDKVVEKAKKKRKDGNKLSPEMDDMINAGSGRRCIKYFRAPARLYFGSNRTMYMANTQDMNLSNVLHEFRRVATIKKFSCAVLKNSGPGVVMSNEMLQHIVDCVHFHKIELREQLEKETHWAGAAEFGDEVITLVQEHCPRLPAPVESDSTPTTITQSLHQQQ